MAFCRVSMGAGAFVMAFCRFGMGAGAFVMAFCLEGAIGGLAARGTVFLGEVGDPVTIDFTIATPFLARSIIPSERLGSSRLPFNSF
tara:strand:+ start:219 stop:479 length:261 start_codon:yes stop_codon:yes gene_type:complete